MPVNTHAPEPSPLLVDARRAAALLSISARKLWSLKASGELPFISIGRAVRFPVAGLRDWIEEKQRAGRGGATCQN